MITLSVEPSNCYSCQNCGKVFESKQEEKVELGFYPVCSNKCEFLVIYNFIKRCQFNDETLMKLQQIAENKENIEDFKPSSAIYSISKYCKKNDLANIKHIKPFGQALSKLRQELSIWTSGQAFVCMKYTQCPSPCPKLEILQNETLSKVFDKKGGIAKWF